MTTDQLSRPVVHGLDRDLNVPEVLVAYEDYETGRRVQEALARFASAPRPKDRVRTTMWKFDLLALGSLREYAAIEATNSDLVWISIHSPADVPVTVTGWLNDWLDRKQSREPVVLVSLDDEPTDPEGGLLGQLRTAAQSANVDLFVKYPVSPTETAVCKLHARTPRKDASLPPFLGRILFENENP